MKYCDNFGEIENHSMKIIRKDSNDLVDFLVKMANRQIENLQRYQLQNFIAI